MNHDDSIPMKWIPYLKFNTILKEMGCIIDWSEMEKIKTCREKYQECVAAWESDDPDNSDVTNTMYEESAFLFDFHCGSTSRQMVGANLLINNVYFSRAECDEFADNYRCDHCCLESKRHLFKGKKESKHFLCGNNPLFVPEHHPCFLVKTEKVRVAECGFDHCFKDNFDDFLLELIDGINTFACKHQQDKQYIHLDLNDIDWSTYDIACYPLRTYLYPESDNVDDEKEIEIIRMVTENGKTTKKRRFTLTFNKSKRQRLSNKKHIENNNNTNNNTNNNNNDNIINNTDNTDSNTNNNIDSNANNNTDNNANNNTTTTTLSSDERTFDLWECTNCKYAVNKIEVNTKCVKCNVPYNAVNDIYNTNNNTNNNRNDNTNNTNNNTNNNSTQVMGQVISEVSLLPQLLDNNSDASQPENKQEEEEQSNTIKTKKKFTNNRTYQGFVDCFQKELLPYVSCDFRAKRFKNCITKIAIKWGRSYDDGLTNINKMRSNVVNKDWNKIMIPQYDINIYENVETPKDWKTSHEFTKLSMKRRKKKNMYVKYRNKGYNELDILSHLCNYNGNNNESNHNNKS
eukprot:123906_1